MADISPVNGSTNSLRPFFNMQPGRVLGGIVDANNDLYVCDAYKGLFVFQHHKVLPSWIPGRVTDDSLDRSDAELFYIDDADTDKKGRIFYSSAQGVPTYMNVHGDVDLLQPIAVSIATGKPEGKLIVYDPNDGSNKVLLDGLWFANGVAVADDDSFVLVCDSLRRRVIRVWLKEELLGKSEIFIENLPGVPDGISRASDGNFWIALVNEPNGETFEALLRWKIFRWFLAWFGNSALFPQYHNYGALAKVSKHGKLLHYLRDRSSDPVTSITAVTEINQKLYIGRLTGRGIVVIDLAMLGLSHSQV